jgi:hypothetical protein
MAAMLGKIDIGFSPSSMLLSFCAANGGSCFFLSCSLDEKEIVDM